MARKRYNLKFPVDLVKDGIIVGQPGEWFFVEDCAFLIWTHDFDGWAAQRWDIDNATWRVDTGFAWNGSNMVPDTDECVPASALHDPLYWFIKHMLHGWWKKLRARRKADKLYRQILDWQGMNRLRARNRYIWVRAFGWIVTRFGKRQER